LYPLYAAIEQSALSIWMREDPYAYFIALIFHALGMALLVGGGIVVSLRVLGVGSGAALHKFRGFFPVMWIGAAMAVLSGLLLLWGYPAKALTNPLFAIKFACLVGAALLLRTLSRGALAAAANGESAPRNSRALAGISLALWLGGVAAGKLLLHTYTVLMVS
jgi:hypothetical protein